MQIEDSRWQQRYENFEKAFSALKRTASIGELSEAERGGLIQYFEMTFELSWRLMKDYLEDQGHTVTSPRDVLKLALQNNIIDDGHTWIQALDDRNATSHLYDEAKVIALSHIILQRYIPLFDNLHTWYNNTL